MPLPTYVLCAIDQGRWSVLISDLVTNPCATARQIVAFRLHQPEQMRRSSA